MSTVLTCGRVFRGLKNLLKTGQQIEGGYGECIFMKVVTGRHFEMILLSGFKFLALWYSVLTLWWLSIKSSCISS